MVVVGVLVVVVVKEFFLYFIFWYHIHHKIQIDCWCLLCWSIALTEVLLVPVGGVVVYASGGVSVLEIVLGNQFEAL